MCMKLSFAARWGLSIVLVCGAVVEAADPSLLGWWRLNEGSGSTAADSSGRGTDGVVSNLGGGLGPNGSAWAYDSDVGNILTFNGNDTTGAYVAAGRIPALGLTTAFTWAFWARQDGDGAGVNKVILGNRYGGTASPLQFIKFTPTNFEYYNAGSSMFINYVDIPAGVWLHHAVVKNGTTLTYYRNGVPSGTSTVTAAMDSNPLYMGGDAAGERWRGSMCEVRIYERALSTVEIRDLAAVPIPATPNPPDGASIVKLAGRRLCGTTSRVHGNEPGGCRQRHGRDEQGPPRWG